MANTLVGLFDDRDAAQGAVSDLISAGFSREKISIIANDGSGGTATYDESGNLAGEGIGSGATSGAMVGGVAGLIVGLGFTVIPIAGVLLAGPIAGLIAGAVSGGLTGGVVGGLLGLGIPKEHAELYAEGIRRGGTLVTVQAETSDENRVREILDRDGAADIETRAANWQSRGHAGFDANAKPFTDAEIVDERIRYTTPINSDWNDTSSAPWGESHSDEGHYGSEFRNHFNRNNPGGEYERHAPAYAYGEQLANDATDIGDWNTNESSYRSRWEERNPGTWDEFKSSVRHAYDKAKNAVTTHSGNNASVR